MAQTPSPSQTLSFLRRRFEEAGIEPQKRLGQNFLIDLNLVHLLARTARLAANDVVLEVGTGTGSLTALMAPQVAAVVTVEMDPYLAQLASEALIGVPNVTLLRQDALKNKNRMHPAVMEAVAQRLAEGPDRRLKLAANLPYNVATPILTNLLAEPTPPQTMTVTIQKELADRLVARPGTKDYGSLSIWVQSQCRVEVVRVMPPSVFWPRPKVSSAIVHVALVDAWRERIADLDFFHGFVRAMFFHRRKLLRRELLSAFKKRLDKPAVDAVLAEVELPANARAEQLDVATMLRLCEVVRAKLPD